jgi:hypothetical protein
LPVIVFSGADAASSEASRENYCEDEDHNGFAQDKVQEVILENRRRSCEALWQCRLAPASGLAP